MFRTVPLSIISRFSLYTQQWYMSYRFADSWHIPLLCVQWKSADDGQRNCPKHVEFYSKNKFEKLVHPAGFIVRIGSNPQFTEPEGSSTFHKIPTELCQYCPLQSYHFAIFYSFSKCFLSRHYYIPLLSPGVQVLSPKLWIHCSFLTFFLHGSPIPSCMVT